MSELFKDAWFIACRSAELSTKPLARTIQGRRLVLFRGAEGASAFSDRCPHRNVPLSLGRVVDGTLECKYHGWRFDSGGACVALPGLVDGEVSLKSRCLERWPTTEHQGFVWVSSQPGVTPTQPPYSQPCLDDARYATVHKTYFVNSGLHAVIENTLDVPHTAFLHGGLFRTAKKSNVIDVKVRWLPTRAEAEFIGEPVPKGLIGRLLAPSGGLVEHTDRFLLPSVAQVEYRLGPTSHLISTIVATPETPTTTRVYAMVTFRLPVPAWLIRPFVTPVASRIFAQDAALLRAMTDNLEAFGGEKFVSSPLDVLGPHIARLLKCAQSGDAPPAPHEHAIKLAT